MTSHSQFSLNVDYEKLALQAAAVERPAHKWADRFLRLFRSGLLRVPITPGNEVALRLRAPRNDTGNVAVAFAKRTLLPLLDSGCCIGVDLCGVEPANPKAWLKEFERGMAPVLSIRREREPSWLFSLTDQHPSGAKLMRIAASRQLGFPRVAVRFGIRGRANTAIPWEDLVADSHANSRIHPVPMMAVRPLIGMHSSEQGEAVMPHSLFEVREDTAWLVLELNAARLINPSTLRSSLSDALRFADNLIDTLDWPRPTLQMDALLNRRVAIQITGLGNLLMAVELDPSCPDSLRRLRRWLLFIRRCFVRESLYLARLRGPFPQLRAQELVANLTPSYGVADAERLVRNRSLRHRHLLAMSPWAVFPDRDGAILARKWLNLIPAIACADTITMYGEDARSKLNVSDWSRLLQMTAAVASSNVLTSANTVY